jgi:hypothetical protein
LRYRFTVERCWNSIMNRIGKRHRKPLPSLIR